MKKLIISAILVLIAILTLTCAAAYADETQEDVQFLEANGRPIGIFLNTADRKSACDGKTTLLTKDMHKGTIKGSERFHGEPNAVVSWSSKTVLTAKVLYRANDTQLDSLFEGSVLCLRGLNADRSRNDDIGEAQYLFMAYLDREGRKVDTIDYVFSVNKITFSITHIRFSADEVKYYLVVGDARKGDPKTKKKDEPKETTDWTIQPVDPISPDPDPDPEWTITGDDDTDPDPDPEWTITGDDDQEDPDTDPDWTIQPGEETPGESQDEDPWTIGSDDTEEDTGFTIGGGDTSDVSLLPDDWTIGGGSSEDSQESEEDTGWSI